MLQLYPCNGSKLTWYEWPAEEDEDFGFGAPASVFLGGILIIGLDVID